MARCASAKAASFCATRTASCLTLIARLFPTQPPHFPSSPFALRARRLSLPRPHLWFCSASKRQRHVSRFYAHMLVQYNGIRFGQSPQEYSHCFAYSFSQPIPLQVHAAHARLLSLRRQGRAPGVIQRARAVSTRHRHQLRGGGTAFPGHCLTKPSAH